MHLISHAFLSSVGAVVQSCCHHLWLPSKPLLAWVKGKQHNSDQYLYRWLPDSMIQGQLKVTTYVADVHNNLFKQSGKYGCRFTISSEAGLLACNTTASGPIRAAEQVSLSWCIANINAWHCCLPVSPYVDASASETCACSQSGRIRENTFWTK